MMNVIGVVAGQDDMTAATFCLAAILATLSSADDEDWAARGAEDVVDPWAEECPLGDGS